MIGLSEFILFSFPSDGRLNKWRLCDSDRIGVKMNRSKRIANYREMSKVKECKSRATSSTLIRMRSVCQPFPILRYLVRDWD